MDWLETLTTVEPQAVLVLRVLIAAVLAMPLGIERERRDRPAGFRTHMLVAMSAAFLAGLGEIVVERYLGNDTVIPDPTRIIHGIVIGVGFIGAGTIIVSKEQRCVYGLTTAAALLLVTAVGIAIGLGLYVAGIATTVLAFAVVAGLGAIERRVQRSNGAARSAAEPE